MLNNSQKMKKLDKLHEAYKAPSIARISNRLVFERYNELNQTYLFIVDTDNKTLVIPLKKGVSSSFLPKDSKTIYLIRNRLSNLTISNINYSYALKLLTPECISVKIENSRKTWFKNPLFRLKGVDFQH